MNKHKTISLSIVTSLLFSNLLYAEETYVLEGVQVTTANKMQEDIKDIPQSITVMTDVDIEEKGIKSINDLIRYIPNLTTTSFNNDKVNFRGINNSQFTNTNPMVIYIDGIPYNNMYGFDKSISNVLRVEVLRGPQGTVYGKDSMGGVINIVTKEPSNTTEGSVTAEYSSYNTIDTAVDVSTPLIDNQLFLGINGAYSHSDGYGTNTYSGQRNNANEKERYLLNAKLLYTPTDRLSIKLNVNTDKNDKYGIEGGAITSGTDVTSYKREDFKNVSYEQDTYTKVKSNSQALYINYDLNNMTFSSLTTRNDTDTDVSLDIGLTDADNGVTYLEQNIQDITQEFRFSGTNDSFKWVTGVYYENSLWDIGRVGATYPGSMFGNPFGTGVNVQMDAVTEIQSDTLAAFGQVVIPFLEKYELTLGGRYQQITKDINSNYYYLAEGTTSVPSNTLNDKRTWDAFLPKIALSYKINKNINTYFSVSKGYLAGGYNYYVSGGTVDQNSFDAQTSLDYELGIRGNLFDDKLYISASVFYMDITDLHVYYFDTLSNVTVTSNAAKAHSQGLELELAYIINESWRIDSSFGLIDAKYDEYKNMSGIDLSGNNIQITPSHTANIGVSYYNPNGLYSRVDIYNQGKIYFNDANTLEENAYSTVNIKVGYLFDEWDIYTYANNITDESYLIHAANTNVVFGNPRFIGIGAKYTF